MFNGTILAMGLFWDIAVNNAIMALSRYLTGVSARCRCDLLRGPIVSAPSCRGCKIAANVQVVLTCVAFFLDQRELIFFICIIRNIASYDRAFV